MLSPTGQIVEERQHLTDSDDFPNSGKFSFIPRDRHPGHHHECRGEGGSGRVMQVRPFE